MIVVKEEQPFALAVRSEFLDNTCSFCLAHKSPVFKCKGCHKLSYCNNECQKNDWSNHKEECRILQNSDDSLSVDERLVLRILLKSEKRLAKKAFNGRTWDSLEDHGAGHGGHPHYVMFMKVAYQIKVVLDTLKDVELQDIFHTLVKVKTNRLDVRDCGCYGVDIASGIYLGLSAHAESCLPTAQVIFVGRKATLRPFDQRAGYSTDLTISRTARSPFNSDRKEGFEEDYFYSCECPLCTDSLYMMNRIGQSCYVDCCKDGVGLMFFDTGVKFKCDKCGADSPITMEDVSNATDILKELSQKLHNKDVFLEQLRKCEKILSPLNYRLVDFCYSTLFDAITEKSYKIMKHLEPRVAAAFEYYFPEGHLTRTSFPMTRSYLTFVGADDFDVDKGYEAGVLTFGEDHPVTQRFKTDMEKYNYRHMMAKLSIRGRGHH